MLLIKAEIQTLLGTVRYKGLFVLLLISYVGLMGDVCILKCLRWKQVTDKHSFIIFMHFPGFLIRRLLALDKSLLHRKCVLSAMHAICLFVCVRGCFYFFLYL